MLYCLRIPIEHQFRSIQMPRQDLVFLVGLQHHLHLLDLVFLEDPVVLELRLLPLDLEFLVDRLPPLIRLVLVGLAGP